MRQIDAVKRATVGLVGDGVPRISVTELTQRVKDQCDRMGIYEPSWASLVKICQKLGYRFDSLDYMNFK